MLPGVGWGGLQPRGWSLAWAGGASAPGMVPGVGWGASAPETVPGVGCGGLSPGHGPWHGLGEPRPRAWSLAWAAGASAPGMVPGMGWGGRSPGDGPWSASYGTRSLRWGQGRGGSGNWGRTLLLTEQSQAGEHPPHTHPWASARSLQFTGPRGPPAAPAPPAGISRAGCPGDP